MKLVIYSISQKQPPIGESIIRWVFDGSNEIDRFWYDKLEIAETIDEWEIEQCKKSGESHLVQWNESGSVYQDDYWSYATVSKGE